MALNGSGLTSEASNPEDMILGIIRLGPEGAQSHQFHVAEVGDYGEVLAHPWGNRAMHVAGV